MSRAANTPPRPRYQPRSSTDKSRRSTGKSCVQLLLQRSYVHPGCDRWWAGNQAQRVRAAEQRALTAARCCPLLCPTETRRQRRCVRPCTSAAVHSGSSSGATSLPVSAPLRAQTWSGSWSHSRGGREDGGRSDARQSGAWTAACTVVGSAHRSGGVVAAVVAVGAPSQPHVDGGRANERADSRRGEPRPHGRLHPPHGWARRHRAPCAHGPTLTAPSPPPHPAPL